MVTVDYRSITGFGSKTTGPGNRFTCSGLFEAIDNNSSIEEEKEKFSR
jgi:hypothetical protein